MAPMVEALHAALDGMELDPSVRVVVIRGAGKDFCAGADLEELLASADRTPAENERDALRLGTLLGRLRSCPRPVVALVTGPGAGGRRGHRHGVRPGGGRGVGATGLSGDPARFRSGDGDGLPAAPGRGKAGIRPGGDGTHPQRDRGPGGGAGDTGSAGRRIRGGGGRTGERAGRRRARPRCTSPRSSSTNSTARVWATGSRSGRGSTPWRGRPPTSARRSAAS